jgi:enterobacterial common antigen flippase
LGTTYRAAVFQRLRLSRHSGGVDAVANGTYGQILRSSALIGGSALATIASGIVRTKIMALMLGPAGVGLLGMYGAVADLAQSVLSLGTNNSGVRQIAEAVGSGDDERIARAIVTLRRVSLLLAGGGALLLVLGSHQISTLTFGEDDRAGAVALLAVAVALRIVSAGQGAVLQGMRRISDLAMLGVLGALFGTVITVPTVYFLGQEGLVPSLVGIAATGLVMSWWYSRGIHARPARMTIVEFRRDCGGVLKLGLAFMASGLMLMGSGYAIRITVLRELGYEAAGLYQAAWALGGLYVGFVLQAMSVDFYPRLTAEAADDRQCNRMVNEQAQVSLLLAGPGVIATLTLAPLVMVAMYSAEFVPGTLLLRWICAGMALRVMTWPMGFILLARGQQGRFLMVDFAWTVVHVGVAWVCVKTVGLEGAGIGFLASYVFHGIFVYFIVRRTSGFEWSIVNKRTICLFGGLTALVFGGFYALPPVMATITGVGALGLSMAYSVRTLTRLVPLCEMPQLVRKLLILTGLAKAEPQRARTP